MPGLEQEAALIYTSGTTGQAKGVELLHSCWLYEGRTLKQMEIIPEGYTQYLWLPLSHVCGKALIERGWDSTRVMGTVFGTAALASVPVLLVADGSWLFTPNGLALALWLGIVTTAVAYLLFGWGLARLTAVTVSTLTLAEPLGATILGLLVLHERLTAASAAGLALIAIGLAVVSAPSRRREEVRDATASA